MLKLWYSGTFPFLSSILRSLSHHFRQIIFVSAFTPHFHNSHVGFSHHTFHIGSIPRHIKPICDNNTPKRKWLSWVYKQTNQQTKKALFILQSEKLWEVHLPNNNQKYVTMSIILLSKDVSQVSTLDNTERGGGKWRKKKSSSLKK